jgi:large subunit ribosomal protein L14e
MRDRVNQQFNAPSKAEAKVIVPGLVCMKIAGRDAGKLCVITEVLDAKFVKIDGFTRPRKVNVNHIEPVGRHIAVKKGASSKDIQAQLTAE